MAKKAGRKVKGCLYKRNGMWWGSWTTFGVRDQRSTGIKVGGKDARKRAQDILDEWVKPFKAESEVAVRAGLVENHQDAVKKAVREMQAVFDAADRIPLADAWKRFPYSMSQKTRGRTEVHPLSPRNVRENEIAWNKFVGWVKEKHGTGLAMQDVTPGMARAYSQHLQEQGYTPSRHNLLVLVCRVMYRQAREYLAQRREDAGRREALGVDSELRDPFEGVDKLRKQQAQHRLPFEKEQVVRMLGAARGEWRGLLAVMYYTGLRAGDAVMLTHANRRKGQIRVTTAKTEAEVVLVEHPELTRILEEVIDRRPPGLNTPLFPTLAKQYREKGAHSLSREFEAFMCRTLGTHQVEEDGTESFIPFEGTEERKRGVRKISRYGLHSFRHALATESCRAGVPLATVQRWLGHASPAVTQIYADHGSAEENQKMEMALSLLEAAPAPLALPAADGVEEEPPALQDHHVAADASAAMVEAVRSIGETASAMNADNWQEKRAEVLAQAEKLLAGMLAVQAAP